MYNHPAGLPRLRRGLAGMLSATRGLAVDAASIMVTRGSQMALALVARALVRPGDAIAVEHPGYRPAWEAFRLAGAEVLPVDVDEQGLNVRALARLASRRPIRAVYVTPHHQFPTTVTLSAPRRLELLRLAARARFAVIEDDYDHEFHYTGQPVLPLASLDRAGLVVYVGTLSKLLAPGLRLGFVAAPTDLIEQLVAYRSFADLQGDHVLESAIAELLEEGLIQRHVRKTRRVYRSRLETLATALRQHLGDFVSFDEPSGGTAIWVSNALRPDDRPMGACGTRPRRSLRRRRRVHARGCVHLRRASRICLLDRGRTGPRRTGARRRGRRRETRQVSAGRPIIDRPRQLYWSGFRAPPIKDAPSRAIRGPHEETSPASSALGTMRCWKSRHSRPPTSVPPATSGVP